MKRIAIVSIVLILILPMILIGCSKEDAKTEVENEEVSLPAEMSVSDSPYGPIVTIIQKGATVETDEGVKIASLQIDIYPEEQIAWFTFIDDEGNDQLWRASVFTLREKVSTEFGLQKENELTLDTFFETYWGQNTIESGNFKKDFFGGALKSLNYFDFIKYLLTNSPMTFHTWTTLEKYYPREPGKEIARTKTLILFDKIELNELLKEAGSTIYIDDDGILVEEGRPEVIKLLSYS